MPSAYTYPGVYVEEVPSGVRTIAGVSTSDTAFIDFFARGPMNDGRPRHGHGGLQPPLRRPATARARRATRSSQYYLNGGQIAWVVRVAAGEPVAGAVPLRRPADRRRAAS